MKGFSVALALAASLSSYWFCLRPMVGAVPSDLFVSPSGSDWFPGSKRFPVRTINHAVRHAGAGTTIWLADGVYHERVHVSRGGNQNAPLTIRASNPGKATLTWQRVSSWTRQYNWRHLGQGVYSSRAESPVYWMVDGAENLFRIPWGGLDALRKVVDGHDFGVFCYDAAECRLYLRRRGGKPPTEAGLATHRIVPGPREWGEFKSSNIWVEADHVVIEGLDLRFGIGSGVRLWKGSNTVVRNCRIRHSQYGVRATSGLEPARGLTIEKCRYDNFPQHRWRSSGWLSWNQVYAAYASNGLLIANQPGTVVRSCLVFDSGDAMQVSCVANESENAMEIRDNLVAWVTDDAFEFDGPACNMKVLGNVVYEVAQCLGVSPVTMGPLEVRNNVFLSHANGINGAQMKWMSPWKLDRVIRNVHIESNIFIGKRAYFHSTPLEHCYLTDNSFAISTDKHVDESSGEKILLWPDGLVCANNHVTWIDKDADALSTWSSTFPRHRLRTRDATDGAFPGPDWIDPTAEQPTEHLQRVWSKVTHSRATP